MLAPFWNDARYSARALTRKPGFLIAAVATIALGVGANAGILTVVNGVLFRDLPAPDGHELVSITQTIEGVPDRQGRLVRAGFSTAEYRAIRERTETLSGILGHSDPTSTTIGGAAPQRVHGTIVTCEYFEVLEQPPSLGRGLRPADCETGADPVVVLAHELWSTTFGSDAGVIGRTIELNRQSFTVVGVAREGTSGGLGPYRTAYFAPISAQPLLLPNEDTYGNDNRSWLAVVGRRAASIEQVRAELGVIAAQLDAEQPGRMTTMHAERARPGFLPFLGNGPARIAAVLMTAFAFLLLIACANVANLLLIRATARSREIAVRLSLGASRGRVIRQCLIESSLISVAGGVAGALIGFWSFHALLGFVLPMLTPVGARPLFVDASPDARVLAAVAAVTLGAGVLFGLAPALRASSTNLHAVIKQDVSGLVGGRRGGRLQTTLVGVQVAMCMVLMIGVGLLLRAAYATRTIDPGFDSGNVVVASYDLLAGGYDGAEAAAFQRRLLDEVSALPSVEVAAEAVLAPLNDREDTAVRLPTEDPSARRIVDVNGVTPSYFDLLGIPLVRGRAFAATDMTDSSVAVIVSETTARNLWPDQEPIGQTLMMAIGPNAEIALDIVGVVRDVQMTSLGENPPYYLYFPAAPRSARLLQLLVKGRSDVASTSTAVRDVVRRLDPNLVVEVLPLEANLAYWRNLSATLTALGAVLGILALALCSVGIYGVVAYFVEQRTREIGIRSALGARFSDVLAMILERTMRPVVLGAIAGGAAAVLLSRTLSGLLFGVSPFDLLGIGAAAAFVVAVAFAAAIVPGRRAARVQPMRALHYE